MLGGLVESASARVERNPRVGPFTAVALQVTSIWRDRICLDMSLLDDHYAAAA